MITRRYGFMDAISQQAIRRFARRWVARRRLARGLAMIAGSCVAVFLAGAQMAQAQAEYYLANPKALQARLNALQYDAGEVDGYPGPQTRNALMRFQVDHCLSPTGQTDLATREALVSARPGVAPCANAGLPPGITANTPLKAGIYVSNPAMCDGPPLAPDDYPDALRIIRGRAITFGVEGACEIRRTDIRSGKTLFRGKCTAGPDLFKARWLFDILSPEEFVEWSGYYTDTGITTFRKCADNSAIRMRWKAWFQ